MPTSGELSSPVVTPRRLTCERPTPVVVNERPGTVVAKSRNWVAAIALRSLLDNTESDSGVSLSLSSRFCAVTMISSRLTSAGCVAARTGVEANAAAKPTARLICHERCTVRLPLDSSGAESNNRHLYPVKRKLLLQETYFL